MVKIREKLASKVSKPPRSRRFKKKENGEDQISIYSNATTQNETNLSTAGGEGIGKNQQRLIEMGITTDYAKTANEPRKFTCKTPTLSRLGVDNFDHIEQIIDLQFNMETATELYKKELKTEDLNKIKRIIKLGLSREVTGILTRK